MRLAAPMLVGLVAGCAAALAFALLALGGLGVFEPAVVVAAAVAAAVTAALGRAAATSAASVRHDADAYPGSDPRSERERAAQTEAKLRAASRMAGFGFWEWDVGADAFRGLDDLYPLLGLDPGAELGFREVMGLVHEDDREVVETALSEAVRDGGPFSYQARFVQPGGRGREVVMHAQGDVEMSAGSAVRVFGSAQDVTRQVQAEQATREAERLFRAAFDGAPLGMTLVAPDGTWIAVNRAWCQMVGYDLQELAGKTFLDLTHPADAPTDKQLIAHVVRGESDGAVFEKRYIHRSGSEIKARVRVAAVRDDSGELVCLVSQAENITERERGQAARDELAAIAEASSDAMFSTDAAGAIRSWNPAAESLYGFSAEAALGLRARDLLGPSSACLTTALSGEAVPACDDVRPLPDGGERHLSLTASPIRDATGAVSGCSCVARDVSDRVRSEAEQRRLDSELARIEKLDGLGKLAGGIAHDFNNLLAVILNYADFLLDDATDDDMRRDLSELRAAAERGAQLTRQLLVFTRHGVTRPEVFAVDPHLLALEPLLHRTLGEDIALTIATDALEATVCLDTSELDQIIMNLAVNARHAMPAGGGLRIGTRELDRTSARRCAAELSGPRYVAIEVEDTGTGMPQQVIERAFEPFFTTKGTGTGLGLATVYGAAKKAGGSVTIDSTPGKGTRITVLLPATDADPTPTPPDAEPAHLLALERLSILVVEDEQPVRDAAVRILSRAGFSVSSASSGAEALELLTDAKPSVVLTDVVMPGMSGTTLADHIHEVDPDLRVVFMSGYNEEGMLRAGLDSSDVLLVEKPFNAQALEAAVRSAISD